MIDIDLTTGIGFAVLLSAIVQLFVKPGLHSYYGGKDQAEQSARYPFLVNVITYVIAQLISAAVLYTQMLPVDGPTWVTLLLSALGVSIMAVISSIGVESFASNVKKVIVN